jgi:hypothetical protein
LGREERTKVEARSGEGEGHAATRPSPASQSFRNLPREKRSIFHAGNQND